MEQTALELLELLPELLPFLQGESIGKNVGRIINNGKVSDHHALLPTKEALGQDFKELSERQRNIFRLIGQRLAQAVSEECVYEETEITVLCEGHEFSAKGKAIVQPGFKRIEDSGTGYEISNRYDAGFGGNPGSNVLWRCVHLSSDRDY